MNILDIRKKIFQLIGIDDMCNMCLVDKLSYQILSTKTFWYKYFNKYDIPITNISYNKPNQWILEFNKCLRTSRHVDNIIYKIENKLLYVLKNGNKWSDEKSLYVNKWGVGINKYYDPEILNVGGVDMINIHFIFNRDAVDCFNKNRSLDYGDEYPQVRIKYKNDKYFLVVEHYGSKTFQTFKYNILKSNAKLILYRFISKGILPCDVNCKIIKF